MDHAGTLVFANAGIHGSTDSLDPDLTLPDQVIDVNIKGVVHTSRSFVKRLIDPGSRSMNAWPRSPAQAR